MAKFTCLEDYKQFVTENYGKAFLKFIKLRDFRKKKLSISSSLSRITTELKFCDKVRHNGREFMRIRNNPETYRFVSKSHWREIYLLPCDNQQIALMIFPHTDIIKDFLKSKGSYSSFSHQIFSVDQLSLTFLESHC